MHLPGRQWVLHIFVDDMDEIRPTYPQHFISAYHEIMETATPSQPLYASTVQASQALGVSVTTVKRWVDDGILPARKTAGGHRKLMMADVLRLVREGNLPHADLARLVPSPRGAAESDIAALRPQLCKALRSDDLLSVRSLLHGAFRSGHSIEVLADRVISPAMVEIGHEWETGRIEVMHEHRATQALVSALYELKGSLSEAKEARRPVAVGGAPEHDHYILPCLLAKMALKVAGWNAVNLGPHTPMSAFISALDNLKPSLIWLSVSHLADPTKFIREYAGFQKLAAARGVAVAVGGRGLPEAVRDRMNYSVAGDKLTELVSFARGLFRIPVNPKRGRPSRKTVGLPA